MIWIAAALSACTTGKPGTTYRHYMVYAETTQGFARSVRANAPRGGRAFGLVEITFHPDYTLKPDGKACAATVKSVGLELVIVLPKWREGKPVPAQVKRTWARFDRTITAHENAHVRIARAYAARMKKSISGMRSASGCGDLKRRIKDRISKLKTQHLRAHDRFDARERKRLKALL
ncbi:DUF922 domain-containing protein [Hoeflea halophila]|uniref:DUF922 domain-containing protein n=1 Tax=Hoeflea halophila TaxID=714899 RepID=UPI0015CC6777|nr:DUF922 domain-containing protein [Hoeflea halophila]